MELISPSGKTYVWEKDTPPTEADIAALQQAESAPPERFIPEMVAGSPDQMQAARARNLQGQLGLAEPVAPTDTVPLMDRIKASFAPTADERKAYYETEYGAGSYMPITDSTALVRVPDGKGGKKWVPDNPHGLDVGDLGALAGQTPQLLTSIASGIAAVPGPQGALAKLAVASGASALAGNTIGAVQDILYRYATNQDINPQEIGERRGLQSLTEFGLGLAAPAAASKIADVVKARNAINAFAKPFIEEGTAAEARLKNLGINPRTAVDVADEIRRLSPGKTSADEAGNAIASVLSDADSTLRGQAEKLLGQSAEDLQGRISADMARVAAPVTPVQAGTAAIGGVKKVFEQARKATDQLYNDAISEINSAAEGSGLGKNIISLKNTENALETMRRDNSLLVKKGEEVVPSDLSAQLLSQIKQIRDTTDVAQSLTATRYLRSMLGEKIHGQSDMFPGLGVGLAKKLYGTLSQDIDESISKFSGAGAAKLRAFNTAYKNLVQPVEQSDFLAKVVNGDFTPQKLISRLSQGEFEDWQAAKTFIPPNTYNRVRRAVMEDMLQGSTENVAGVPVSNVALLSQKMAAMPAEVKTEIFGAPAAWKAIEKKGQELQFLKSKEGMFTDPALPTLNQLTEAMTIAKTQGYDKANWYLNDAIEAAAKRRENIASGFISLIRNGTVNQVAENPGKFFDTVVLSGKFPPATVKSVLDKLPSDVRTNVGDAAFQSIWEKAKSTTESMVKGAKSRYDYETMMKNVFGSKNQQETVKNVVGEQRFNLIQDWTSYMMKLAIQTAKTKDTGRSLAGLIAVAPYHNLFAARATAYAMSNAAGQVFIHNTTPEAAALFAEARLVMKQPQKTAAGIAVLQRAMNQTGFNEYQSMMSDLTPEQQDAVDQYLTKG